jgi:hypothetical protein
MCACIVGSQMLWGVLCFAMNAEAVPTLHTAWSVFVGAVDVHFLRLVM